MMSPSVSPGDSPTQQARNAGVLPPPAHVALKMAAVVGHLEESSGQQGSDTGIRGPPPVQGRPMDAVGGRRGPDLIFPNFGRRRPAQGRPGAAPAGHWLPVLVGFSFLSFNSATATYRSWGDTDTVFFIVSASCTMVGLFFSVKRLLAAAQRHQNRGGETVCVWILTVALASEFVYHTTGTTTKPTMHLTLLLLAMPTAIGASVFIIFRDRFGAPQGEELPDVPLAEELPDVPLAEELV